MNYASPKMLPQPNTTAALQPIDAGMIANFKASYRHHMLKWLATKIDVSVTGPSASRSPDLKIDRLKAVCFVYSAWYEVNNMKSQTTISNCFRKGFACQDN